MMDNKCIICGAPCKYRWSICRECQVKGGKEKEDYVKYVQRKDSEKTL